MAAVPGRQLSVALPWEDGECVEKAMLELALVLARNATEAVALADQGENEAGLEMEIEAMEAVFSIDADLGTGRLSA